MKGSCSRLFFKDFAEIESDSFLYYQNSGTASFKERPFFLNKNSIVFEIKNRKS